VGSVCCGGKLSGLGASVSYLGGAPFENGRWSVSLVAQHPIVRSVPLAYLNVSANSFPPTFYSPDSLPSGECNTTNLLSEFALIRHAWKPSQWQPSSPSSRSPCPLGPLSP
jgi:hypothetical protein